MPAEDYDRLTSLEVERDRLELLLEADESWRALRQLDAREGAGNPLSSVDAGGIRSRLEAALQSNRVYVARRKISDAIRLLREVRADMEGDAPPSPVDAARDAPVVSSSESLPVRPVITTEADSQTTPIAPRAVTFAAIEARAVHGLASVDTPAPHDDLTRIRPIDRALASRLAALGVRYFEDIAGWTAADVARISVELGLGRTLSQQNWIEQAALFAAKKPGKAIRPAASETHLVKRETSMRAEGGAAAAAMPASQGAIAPVSTVSTRAITDLVAAAARSILAGATLPRTELMIDVPAREASASEDADTAIHDAAALHNEPVAVMIDTSEPEALEAGPEDIEPVPQPTDRHEPAAPVSEPDDLMLLDGMTESLAAALRDAGVRHFRDIAEWTADDVVRARSVLGDEGSRGSPARRVGGWIEEAALRAAGAVPYRQSIAKHFGNVALVRAPAASETQHDAVFASWLKTHATPEETDELRASPSTEGVALLDDAVSLESPAVEDLTVAEKIDSAPPQLPRDIDLVVRVSLPEPLPVAESLEIKAEQVAAVETPPQPAVAAPVDVAASAQPVVPVAIDRVRPRLEIKPLPELPFSPAPAHPEESMSDEPAGRASHMIDPFALPEARVEIVKKAPYQRAQKVEEPVEAPLSSQGVNTLHSRLRGTHPRAEEFDGSGYAAYRFEVDEASVEIVKAGRVGEARLQMPDLEPLQSDGSQDDTGGADVSAQSSRSVGRFLKALTGQDQK